MLIIKESHTYYPMTKPLAASKKAHGPCRLGQRLPVRASDPAPRGEGRDVEGWQNRSAHAGRDLEVLVAHEALGLTVETGQAARHPGRDGRHGRPTAFRHHRDRLRPDRSAGGREGRFRPHGSCRPSGLSCRARRRRLTKCPDRGGSGVKPVRRCPALATRPLSQNKVKPGPRCRLPCTKLGGCPLGRADAGPGRPRGRSVAGTHRADCRAVPRLQTSHARRMPGAGVSSRDGVVSVGLLHCRRRRKP